MSDDENSTSIKELLLRIESSLKNEINGLKREVELFQQRSVTRTEYDTAMTHVRSELERLERQQERQGEKQESDLKTFRQDIKDSQARAITIVSLLITAVNFLLTWLIK